MPMVTTTLKKLRGAKMTTPPPKPKPPTKPVMGKGGGITYGRGAGQKKKPTPPLMSRVQPRVGKDVPAPVVKAILTVGGHLGASHDITMDSRLTSDLGFDSLDVVEVAMELEAAYNVMFDDERDGEAFEEGTIRDIVQALKTAGAVLDAPAAAPVDRDGTQ